MPWHYFCRCRCHHFLLVPHFHAPTKDLFNRRPNRPQPMFTLSIQPESSPRGPPHTSCPLKCSGPCSASHIDLSSHLASSSASAMNSAKVWGSNQDARIAANGVPFKLEAEEWNEGTGRPVQWLRGGKDVRARLLVLRGAARLWISSEKPEEPSETWVEGVALRCTLFWRLPGMPIYAGGYGCVVDSEGWCDCGEVRWAQRTQCCFSKNIRAAVGTTCRVF